MLKKSKLQNAELLFTFDDFTLDTVHSRVKSRKSPDVSVRRFYKNYGNIDLSLPIIASPMNTVAEGKMISCMYSAGATAVLHRYMTIEAQIEIVKSLEEQNVNDYFVAIGAVGDYFERACRLYDVGVTNFCIDVANGHSQICVDAVKKLAKFNEDFCSPKIHLMAGNVCNYDGAMRLVSEGCTHLRVGIGPGSMCTTRLVTGHGVPQLSAIEDCVRAKQFHDFILISDGGIRSSGDIVKAIAIGADCVMIGGLLAGTDETPGDFITKADGYRYKKYAGMASEDGRAFGSWFDNTKTSFVPEGESTLIRAKGPAAKVIENLVGGLRVGMTLSNASSLEELRKNAVWKRVTENGKNESTAHGKK